MKPRSANRLKSLFDYSSLEPRSLMVGDAGNTLQSAQSLGKIGGSEIVLQESVGSPADVDLFRFEVSNGQRVAFDIDTVTNGPPGLGSYLRIFDATGRQLDANNDRLAPGDPAPGQGSGGIGFDSYINYFFTQGGTYYAGVSNWQHQGYNPVTGAPNLGSDPNWLTGNYSLVITSGMADLSVSSLKYSVDADRGNRPFSGQVSENGPLPTNAAIRLNVSVKNSGDIDSGTFTVAVYLSRDSRIDSSDAVVRYITVQSLPGGSSREVSERFVIPASAISGLSGTVTIGTVVDSQNQVSELSEANNSNLGTGIDSRNVRLFDPIPEVAIYEGFSSEKALNKFIRKNKFSASTWPDVGFTRNLPSKSKIISPMDGVARSGSHYRQHGFAFGPNGTLPTRITYYDINSQSWQTRSFSTYSFFVQGTTAVGEPRPWRAVLGGPSWFRYVAEWHDRF
jgi:hypothetical protein